MNRDVDEVLASQNKMLDARGEATGTADDAKMREVYGKHLEKVGRFLRSRSCFTTLQVRYRDVIDNPPPKRAGLNEFLGGRLGVEQMSAVADRELLQEPEDESRGPESRIPSPESRVPNRDDRSAHARDGVGRDVHAGGSGRARAARPASRSSASPDHDTIGGGAPQRRRPRRARVDVRPGHRNHDRSRRPRRAHARLLPGCRLTAPDRVARARSRTAALERAAEISDRLAAAGARRLMSTPCWARPIPDRRDRWRARKLPDALIAAGHVGTVSGRSIGFCPRAVARACRIAVRRRGGRHRGHRVGAAASRSLAHPGTTKRDDIIAGLADAGLSAIEAHHSAHDAATVERCRRSLSPGPGGQRRFSFSRQKAHVAASSSVSLGLPPRITSVCR